METIDPATGQTLPEDAIQRILFVSPSVHVYNIPPLTSTKGYTAATWTADPSRHIFSARLRVLETSYDDDDSTSSSPRLKADVVLEDPSTGQLFAAAPYTSASAVEPVLDSSRFFALTVRDPAGRRAVLGVGFEERSDAFDFGVALQEARKALGVDDAAASAESRGRADNGTKSGAGGSEEDKKDYSLKEGETITVSVGGRAGRPRRENSRAAGTGGSLAGFALPPPPGSGASSSLQGGSSSLLPPPPPPPGTAGGGRQTKQAAQDLGFDDGADGEFA